MENKLLYSKSLNKDYEELIESAIDRLKDKTQLSNFNAGSIVRSILEVFYEDFDILYEELSYNVLLNLLSSSYGSYLDELAKIVAVEREPGESDENFKYRIQKQQQEKAKANQTSIKLSCLSKELTDQGVNDVIFKKFHKGVGTFGAYLITDNPETPQGLVDLVQGKIEETQAYGVQGEVIKPNPVYIDLDITYTFYQSSNSSRKKEIQDEAEIAIREYMVGQKSGGKIIINELIHILMGINSNQIKNVRINNAWINNKEVIINDKEFSWTDRIVPRNIKIH